MALGAFVLEGVAALGQGAGHEPGIAARDFGPAFLAVAVVSGLSVLSFRRLHPDAGAEMSGQRVVRAKPVADSA